MQKPLFNRLDPLVQKELERCPLPYEVKMGKGHIKIIVAGIFVGASPADRSSDYRRNALNTCAKIRHIVAGSPLRRES